jgi:hypothetical protein
MSLTKILGSSLLLALVATGCAATTPATSAVSTTAVSAGSTPRLDGQRYKVLLSAGDQRLPDELTFDHGAFDSSACRGFGFGPAAYTCKDDGSAVEFQVDARSKDAVNHWRGRIAGRHVTGTVTEERNGAVAGTYTFEGDEG